MAEAKLRLIADDEISPVIKKLTGLFNPLKKGIGDANESLGSLQAGIQYIPIIAIILAALYFIISSIKSNKAFEKVDKSFNDLKDTLKDLQDGIDDLKTSLTGLDEKLNKIFEAFPNKRAQALKAAMKIRDIFQGVNDNVKGVGDKGFLDLSTLEKQLDEALKQLGDSLNVDIPKLAADSVSSIEQDMNTIKEQFSSLDPQLDKQLTTDTSDVPFAVASAKSYLDSIPNVTVKTLLVKVMTQASPVRPFGEGMAHVRRELETLPQGQDFTLRFNRRAAQHPAGLYSSEGGTTPSTSTAGASFAPVININGAQSGGREMARDLDRELARLWRTRRSHLREAMDHA